MAAKNPVGTQALERGKTCGVWSFDRRLLAVQYVFKAPNASSELDFNVRRACSASPYEVLNLGELLSLVPTASFFSRLYDEPSIQFCFRIREKSLGGQLYIPKLSILIYANTCLVNHLTHIIHRFSHVCLPLGMNGLYGIWCVQLVGVTIFPSAGRKQVHPFVDVLWRILHVPATLGW